MDEFSNHDSRLYLWRRHFRITGLVGSALNLPTPVLALLICSQASYRKGSCYSHLKPCIYSKMARHESCKCIKRSPAWSILTKSSKIDNVCSSFLHEGELAFPQGATLFANPYLIVTFVKFWLWRTLRWALCYVVQGLNLSQFVVIFNDALYFVCQ